MRKIGMGGWIAEEHEGVEEYTYMYTHHHDVEDRPTEAGVALGVIVFPAERADLIKEEADAEGLHLFG